MLHFFQQSPVLEIALRKSLVSTFSATLLPLGTAKHPIRPMTQAKHAAVI